MNWQAVLDDLDDALAASYDARRHRLATRLRWRLYNAELERYGDFIVEIDRQEERLVREGFDDVPPFPGYRVRGVGAAPSYRVQQMVWDRLHELFPGDWPEYPEYPHDPHVRHVRRERMNEADWRRQFEESYYRDTGIPSDMAEDRERMKAI